MLIMSYRLKQKADVKEEDRVPLKRWRAGNSTVKPAVASGTQEHSGRALIRADGVSDTGLQRVLENTA